MKTLTDLERNAFNSYGLPVPKNLLERVDRTSSPVHTGNLRNAIDFVVPEQQIRRIFDNEIRYDIGNNSGIQDDISFIIEDDTFLVGDLRSTVSWSLVGQHVILYVEILNEKNRIDFNLILCPNHNLERDIITKMRNISSLNIDIMGKYRSTKVGEDITSDQDSAINHFVSKPLSFIGFNFRNDVSICCFFSFSSR